MLHIPQSLSNVQMFSRSVLQEGTEGPKGSITGNVKVTFFVTSSRILPPLSSLFLLPHEADLAGW